MLITPLESIVATPSAQDPLSSLGLFLSSKSSAHARTGEREDGRVDVKNGLTVCVVTIL